MGNKLLSGGSRGARSFSGAGSPDTFKVKVTAADTTENYANSKIVAGSRITTAVLNPGANEQLQINADVQNGDGKVLVSNADTTRNYLESKVLAGSHIAVTKENPAGNEDLKIKVSTVTDWLDCKNWSYGSSAQFEVQKKQIGQWVKDTAAFTNGDFGYFDYAFPDVWDLADPYLTFYAMSDCPGSPTSIRLECSGIVLADGDNLNTITYPARVNMDRTYSFQYEFQVFPETAIPLTPAVGSRTGKTYVAFRVYYNQTGTCSTLHLIGARIRYGLV